MPVAQVAQPPRNGPTSRQWRSAYEAAVISALARPTVPSAARTRNSVDSANAARAPTRDATGSTWLRRAARGGERRGGDAGRGASTASAPSGNGETARCEPSRSEAYCEAIEGLAAAVRQRLLQGGLPRAA